MLTLNMPAPMSDPWSGDPACRHIEEMKASGIPDELLIASGIRTVTGPEACQMLSWTKNQESAGQGWAILLWKSPLTFPFPRGV